MCVYLYLWLETKNQFLQFLIHCFTWQIIIENWKEVVVIARCAYDYSAARFTLNGRQLPAFYGTLYLFLVPGTCTSTTSVFLEQNIMSPEFLENAAYCLGGMGLLANNLCILRHGTWRSTFFSSYIFLHQKLTKLFTLLCAIGADENLWIAP